MRVAEALAAPIPRAAERARLSAVSPLGILVAAMAILVLAAPPAGEFPIDDDWNYTRMVQALVERGQLELPPWSAASLLLQTVWGALFARLLGFSFATLRESTLVLGAVAVLGTYVLLRNLTDGRRALFGSLLLLFNPLFVFRSYSFMSDVPFLALAVWSMVCYVRAFRGSTAASGWLLAGSALAAGSYLIRQVGVLLPVACFVVLLLRPGQAVASRSRRLVAVVLPLLPALLLGAYFDAMRAAVKQEPLSWTLGFWAHHGLGMSGILLARLAEALSTLGLFTLPLTIGILADRRSPRFTARQRLAIAAVIAVMLTGLIVRTVVLDRSPLFPHAMNVLSAHGFQAFDYNDTLPAGVDTPTWALALTTIAALVGGGFLIVATTRYATGPRSQAAAGVPLVFGALAFLATLAYYTLYDSYLVALLPSAILMVALAVPAPRWESGVAVVAVALLAAWSIWWEREYLQRRDALWKAGQALVQLGVPPEEIDGGYEWNGWFRGQAIFDSAIQQSKSGSMRQLENFVLLNLRKRMRWTIAFQPPEASGGGRVLTVLPYGVGQHVYAIQRQ